MLANARSRPTENRAPAAPTSRGAHEPLLRPGIYPALKRVFDFTLALLICIPALPLIVLAALLVKLTSRGPVFYSQVRLGLHGRPFRIWKIRSMVADSEKNGACWSKPGDPRITRVGRILRKTHLDELPQLWNVLRGDMSLVGPRPERPEFVPSLEQAIPHYRDRLQVRPGLTGLAQVQLPPDTDLESVRRKLACDLHYIGRLTWWLDVRLILATSFYLVSLPCGWPCRILRIPSCAVAEETYERLARERTEEAPPPPTPLPGPSRLTEPPALQVAPKTV